MLTTILEGIFGVIQLCKLAASKSFYQQESVFLSSSLLVRPLYKIRC